MTEQENGAGTNNAKYGGCMNNWNKENIYFSSVSDSRLHFWSDSTIGTGERKKLIEGPIFEALDCLVSPSPLFRSDFSVELSVNRVLAANSQWICQWHETSDMLLLALTLEFEMNGILPVYVCDFSQRRMLPLKFDSGFQTLGSRLAIYTCHILDEKPAKTPTLNETDAFTQIPEGEEPQGHWYRKSPLLWRSSGKNEPEITAVKFSSDGNMLAVGLKDGSVTVLSVRIQKRGTHLKQYYHRFLVVAGQDDRITLFFDRSILDKYSSQATKRSLATTPAGNPPKKRSKLKDKQTQTPVVGQGILKFFNSITSPSGKTLFTSKLQLARVHTSFITALALSDDGKYLVSGGYDGQLYVWRIEDILTQHQQDLQEPLIPALSISIFERQIFDVHLRGDVLLVKVNGSEERDLSLEAGMPAVFVYRVPEHFGEKENEKSEII
ncbi:uncharacterized protein VTP21DRAFT_405 [Calcarisporiella thermophila]|uniref:uncharacterized protein n=1 Tax=Calcarisporiella thermophila TaxID=911321 RepID=UPI003743C3F8